MLSKTFAILLVSLSLAFQIFGQKIIFDFSQSSEYRNKNLLEFLSKNISQKKTKSIADSVLSKSDFFMKQNGYFFSEIKIDSMKYSKDSTELNVLLNIRKNKRSAISGINVYSDSNLDSAYVYDKMYLLIGKPFIPADVEKVFHKILQHYENNGFPFAKIKIQSVKWDEKKNAQLFIKFINGKSGTIDSILIKGNSKTKDYVILRNLGIKKGEKYSRKNVLQAVKNLARLNFFSKISKPKFYYDTQNHGILEIDVVEKNTNFFDGVIGYIPKTNNGGGFLTGYVKADLRNIFGTERAFNFEWKKLDKFSQYFDIAYTEPWIFAFPLNVNLQVNQRKQDTSYVQRKYGITFEFIATANLKASLLYSYEETIPFETNVLQINHSTFNTSGIKFFYDKRDNVILPVNGFLIQTTFKYSRKTIFENNSQTATNNNDDLFRIEADVFGFLKIYKINAVAAGLHFRDLESKNKEISDLYRFGGTNTVRGYSEDIFFGDKIIWGNLEYRILLSYSSLAFLFFDSGYYTNDLVNIDSGFPNKEFIYGYGAGLSFSTGLGIMKISFALGKGDSFSQAKIHFGLSNGF